MDAYSVYLDVLDKVNKEENGYLPADLFNRLAQVAARYVFNNYQSRLQNPNTAAIEKGEIQDRLQFCITDTILVTENGKFVIPSDYGYFSNGRINFDGGDSAIILNSLGALMCEAEDDPTILKADLQQQMDDILNAAGFVDIELMDHVQVGRRLNSYIPGKRPSLAKPIMERVGGGFQVYPKEVGTVIFFYYRRPQPGKLIMTQDPVTLDLIYDNINSVPFEWGDESLNDLEIKIAQDFSIYIREKDLFQMSEAQTQKQ